MKHKKLGRKTIHHMVPTRRLRDYYGAGVTLPRNKMMLWELRHMCWHFLFGLKTINEVIAYLNRRTNNKEKPFYYQNPAWEVLFKNKTPKEARNLLLRVRRKIRKKYEHFEFDPMLRDKVKKYHRNQGSLYVDLHLQRNFKVV